MFLLPNEINLLAKIPSKLKKKKIFGIAKRDETKNVLIQRWFLLFRCLKWTSRLSLFMLLCDSFVDVWLSQVCVVSLKSEMKRRLLVCSIPSSHQTTHTLGAAADRSVLAASWTRAAVLLSLGTSDKTAKSQAEHLVPLSAPSGKFPVPPPPPLTLSDLTAEVISLNEEVSSCKKGTLFSESFLRHATSVRYWEAEASGTAV